MTLKEKVETFYATKFDDTVIELAKQEDISTVYNLILGNHNFIIVCNDGNEQVSKLVISSSLESKIKTGEMVLRSKQKKKDVK